MKVFNTLGKINFVDTNNIFVGFDTGCQCCENADWFISNAIISTNIIEQARGNNNLEDYIFDKNFFKTIKNNNELEEGGVAIFRLVCNGKEDLYLHLFNCQNGYYSHGFEMTEMIEEKEKTIIEDYL